MKKLGILGAFVLMACTFVACSENGNQKGRPTHDEIGGKPDLKANAADLKHTIVTPHLECRIEPGKNVLWCTTFQLAWNELCDLSGGPISMESAPPMVAVLNKRTASKDDLDEASYVALAGLRGEGIYEKIRNELDEKFGGGASPELFESVPRRDWVTYAYLFKALPFEWAFKRWHNGMVFEGYWVDCFGIFEYNDRDENAVRVANQVAVVDHQNDDDFIVELTTRAKDDRLVLAKVPPDDSLAETVTMVRQRMAKAEPTKMRSAESLSVPVLDFDILREYSELYGRPIGARSQEVDATEFGYACQSIRFRLDETGAVLKSESIDAEVDTPRSLVFDKPFLILLQRRGADNPYFALWVGNPELLVPAEKRKAPRRR